MFYVAYSDKVEMFVRKVPIRMQRSTNTDVFMIDHIQSTCCVTYQRETNSIKNQVFPDIDRNKGIPCEVNRETKKKIKRNKKTGSKYKELENKTYKSYALIHSQVDQRKNWFETPGVW